MIEITYRKIPNSVETKVYRGDVETETLTHLTLKTADGFRQFIKSQIATRKDIPNE